MELKPKDIDQLGQDEDLAPNQKKLLEVFRIVDLRVEWSCRQSIMQHNWKVILTALILVGEGQNLVAIITKIVSAVFK